MQSQPVTLNALLQTMMGGLTLKQIKQYPSKGRISTILLNSSVLESAYSDYLQQAFPTPALKIYYFYLKLWIVHSSI